MALFFQLILKRLMIFYNTVMNQPNPAGAVTMRMSILLGRNPVSGPPGMSNAQTSGDILATYVLLQFLYLAHGFMRLHLTLFDHRQTGGVITPIFQPL